jgi:hypothetical protein
VSPFRAVVKIDKHARSQYVSEDEKPAESLTDDSDEEEQDIQRHVDPT